MTPELCLSVTYAARTFISFISRPNSTNYAENIVVALLVLLPCLLLPFVNGLYSLRYSQQQKWL